MFACVHVRQQPLLEKLHVTNQGGGGEKCTESCRPRAEPEVSRATPAPTDGHEQATKTHTHTGTQNAKGTEHACLRQAPRPSRSSGQRKNRASTQKDALTGSCWLRMSAYRMTGVPAAVPAAVAPRRRRQGMPANQSTSIYINLHYS